MTRLLLKPQRSMKSFSRPARPSGSEPMWPAEGIWPFPMSCGSRGWDADMAVAQIVMARVPLKWLGHCRQWHSLASSTSWTMGVPTKA
jgi:hypothetical protein